MAAQAISGCLVGISNRGDCAVVEVNAFGSHLSTKKCTEKLHAWGNLCFGLHLPDPV